MVGEQLLFWRLQALLYNYVDMPGIVVFNSSPCKNYTFGLKDGCGISRLSLFSLLLSAATAMHSCLTLRTFSFGTSKLLEACSSYDVVLLIKLP